MKPMKETPAPLFLIAKGRRVEEEEEGRRGRRVVVPKVAWPQRSISSLGVNHLRSNSPSVPLRRTRKAVSDRLFSVAISCMIYTTKNEEKMNKKSILI